MSLVANGSLEERFPTTASKPAAAEVFCFCCQRRSRIDHYYKVLTNDKTLRICDKCVFPESKSLRLTEDDNCTIKTSYQKLPLYSKLAKRFKMDKFFIFLGAQFRKKTKKEANDAPETDYWQSWTSLSSQLSIPVSEDSNRESETGSAISCSSEYDLTLAKSQLVIRRSLHEPMEKNLVAVMSSWKIQIDDVVFVWLYFPFVEERSKQKYQVVFEKYKKKMLDTMQQALKEFGKLKCFDIIKGSLCIRFGLQLRENVGLSYQQQIKKLTEKLTECEALKSIPHPFEKGKLLKRKRFSIDEEAVEVDLVLDYDSTEALNNSIKEYFLKHVEDAFLNDEEVAASRVRLVDQKGHEVVVQTTDTLDSSVFKAGASVQVSAGENIVRGVVMK